MNPNYNSDYDIRLAELSALGGDTTKCYDSVYEIDLAILEEIQGGGIATKVIDDTSISLDKTWSSSKINKEIQAIVGISNSDIEGKETEDFTFVTELPESGEENAQVIIKGENVDTLYKYVSGSWVEQTPDATKLYFDTENEALYSYVSADHQFAPVSLVNTIVVGSNLNTNTALKAIKTPGVYSVVQRLHNSTKGDYIKNWTLTVEGVDYEEYERTDTIYQRLQSYINIYKRTWSSTRETNDGWSNFSIYYAGEIKDTTTSKYYTWSSNKLNDLYENPKGYAFNATKGTFAEKYKQDSADGGQIRLNTATGLGSHAEGYSTTASGDYGSHSEGALSVASGIGSHAEGNGGKATAQSAHAEGEQTNATGIAAHAEGYSTTAIGLGSHAEGYGGLTSDTYNKAIGYGSHVEGVKTMANNMGEHAEGNGNVSHKASKTFGNAGNTTHSVGISTLVGSDTPKNAFEIMQNGDMYVLGVGGYQGTDTKVQNGAIKTLQQTISTIELPQDMFRLKSKQKGSTIYINNAHTAFATSSYKYSFDGITWNTLSDTAITVDLNKVIYIKGTAGQSTTSSSNTAFFVTTGNFDAYGNLGWLYDENNHNASVYKENTLMGLFREAVISDMDVWCNVQKTQKNALSGMFYGSNITSSVKFNHIIDCERASAWYRGCTALVNAYPLYFKNYTYSLAQLYRGCTALKNVYVECDYSTSVGNMFTDCTSLENIYLVVHYYVYSTANFANNVPTTCNVHLTDYAQYTLNNTTLTLTKDIHATKVYDNDIQLPPTDTNHLLVNTITYDGEFRFSVLKPTDNITYWNYLLSHSYLYIQEFNNTTKFTICFIPSTGTAQVVKAIGVLNGNFGKYECTYDSATDTMTHTFTPIS